MLPNIESLQSLHEDEIHRIRDIYVPMVADDDGKRFALKLQSAIAYTGDPMAKRLFVPDNSKLMDRLLQIAEVVDGKIQDGKTRFRIDAGGMSFRAQVGHNAKSADLQLRALPADVPSLNELSMDPAWRRLMVDESLFGGGLILISAPHGQGKTTTASSMVATRLKMFGGMANTYEDPIELPLQGVWGQGGLCIQRDIRRTEAQHSDPLGYALMDSLRQYPAVGSSTIMFIGEIMDGSAAVEALKAAGNGHLVIATIHGRGLEAAIRRLVLLCCTQLDGMQESSVRTMISQILRGVFNQRLVWTLGGSGWSAARGEGEVLWSDSPESELAKAVRSGDQERLAEVISDQYARLREDPERYLESMGVRARANS